MELVFHYFVFEQPEQHSIKFKLYTFTSKSFRIDERCIKYNYCR